METKQPRNQRKKYVVGAGAVATPLAVSIAASELFLNEVPASQHEVSATQQETSVTHHEVPPTTPHKTPPNTILSVHVHQMDHLLMGVNKMLVFLEKERKIAHPLQDQYNSAITGTLPSIARFGGEFEEWKRTLHMLAEDMEQVYAQLLAIYDQAQHIHDTLTKI